MAVSFPASFLQTLQVTFHREAIRICRDAAKLLRVPEKELTNKVLGKVSANSIFKVLDDNDAPTICPIIIKQGSIFERCRCPCILGTGRCLSHQTAGLPPDVSNHTLPLTRLEQHPDLQEPLWCREETNEIYDRSGKVIGEREDNCIVLYTLGSEEEEE